MLDLSMLDNKIFNEAKKKHLFKTHETFCPHPYSPPLSEIKKNELFFKRKLSKETKAASGVCKSQQQRMLLISLFFFVLFLLGLFCAFFLDNWEETNVNLQQCEEWEYGDNIIKILSFIEFSSFIDFCKNL